MKIQNVQPYFVTEVTDFDINSASKNDIDRIKNLIYERKVVALKNQVISRKTYQDFAKKFGKIEKFKLKNYHDPEYPNILVINNRNINNGIGAKKLGNMWHSDSTYLKEPLPLTFLHAQQVPENSGDTLFIDVEKLLNDLPKELSEELNGISAVHDVRWTYKVKKEDIGESIQEIFNRLEINTPPSLHPAIIVHPRTGRKGLFINPGYTVRIDNYDEKKSREILSRIFSIALNPERVFSYQWSINDLVIWDNRLVWHCATEIPPEADRVMYRIGINDGGFFHHERTNKKGEETV